MTRSRRPRTYIPTSMRWLTRFRLRARDSGNALMYFANDGGIYRALDGFAGLNTGSCSGTNQFDDLNQNLGSMTQFVSFSQHPDRSRTRCWAARRITALPQPIRQRRIRVGAMFSAATAATTPSILRPVKLVCLESRHSARRPRHSTLFQRRELHSTAASTSSSPAARSAATTEHSTFPTFSIRSPQRRCWSAPAASGAARARAGFYCPQPELRHAWAQARVREAK